MTSQLPGNNQWLYCYRRFTTHTKFLPPVNLWHELNMEDGMSG